MRAETSPQTMLAVRLRPQHYGQRLVEAYAAGESPLTGKRVRVTRVQRWRSRAVSLGLVDRALSHTCCREDRAHPSRGSPRRGVEARTFAAGSSVVLTRASGRGLRWLQVWKSRGYADPIQSAYVRTGANKIMTRFASSTTRQTTSKLPFHQRGINSTLLVEISSMSHQRHIAAG